MSMKFIDKEINHLEVENKLYEKWLLNDLFKSNPVVKMKNFLL